MHLHILGICGTFMGGIALLARALGHRVSGADANVYPPMSTQLARAGIPLTEGWDPAQLEPTPDVVVIGNALSRGNPAVEAVLDRNLPYTSGPQWLAEQVLRGRWVLGVAGTHGKTTTASLLAWILECAGLAPGFLIGGIPENFGVSARLGRSPFFVVEADEYDTAFFDKRSKFVHYRPRTAVLNNLEYDHADIFPDLASIQRQFHHLVRTVPAGGLILHPADDAALDEVLAMGCWSRRESFGGEHGNWQARLSSPDGRRFEVSAPDGERTPVTWDSIGLHNVSNALAALGAARHAGVPTLRAIPALASFRSVKRRLEQRGNVAGILVYDDFAHHPTAIRATLDGLRRTSAEARLIAILEPRSNTMRLGVHRETLGPALAAADLVILFTPPELRWDPAEVLASLGSRARAFQHIEAIINYVGDLAQKGDRILIMSNGGFGGIHERLLDELKRRQGTDPR